MRLLERFQHGSAAPQFLDFRPTLFFGVPTIYVRLLEMQPEGGETSASPCGYLFPVWRRCPLRYSKIFQRLSAT